jgi:quinol monooxygenase YgiN
MNRRHLIQLTALTTFSALADGSYASSYNKGSEMEIFLFARLHARPGSQRELKQAIHDVQGPTRGEPGCLNYHAFQSIRDPDEFYIHSRWRDMTAFEQHVQQPHTIRFSERVEQLMDHPLSPVLTRLLP